MWVRLALKRERLLTTFKLGVLQVPRRTAKNPPHKKQNRWVLRVRVLTLNVFVYFVLRRFAGVWTVDDCDGFLVCGLWPHSTH